MRPRKSQAVQCDFAASPAAQCDPVAQRTGNTRPHEPSALLNHLLARRAAVQCIILVANVGRSDFVIFRSLHRPDSARAKRTLPSSHNTLSYPFPTRAKPEHEARAPQRYPRVPVTPIPSFHSFPSQRDATAAQGVSSTSQLGPSQPSTLISLPSPLATDRDHFPSFPSFQRHHHQLN